LHCCSGMQRSWHKRWLWTVALLMVGASYSACAWLWAAPYRAKTGSFLAAPAFSAAALHAARRAAAPVASIDSAAPPLAPPPVVVTRNAHAVAHQYP